MDSTLILTLAAAAGILAAPEASAWQSIDLATRSGDIVNIGIADDLRLTIDATTLGVSGNGYDLTYPVADVLSITPHDSSTDSTVPAIDACGYFLTADGVNFSEATDVAVTDAAGRTVVNLTAAKAVSFGKLPAGVYIVSAASGRISLKVLVK